ncbi:MAG: beta-lactamase family protein [Chloroflexi bacterium]|nr:beta-lactamase family protein [Chloroflexota bacterium]
MAELDAMFTELVAEENIPGMAVAIVAQGEVVWSEGYGFANIQTQQPVTPDTPFLIASVSKLFTGVGVMKAWEQGHLSLDANINDYLSFPVDNLHLNDHSPRCPALINECATPVDLVMKCRAPEWLRMMK